MLTKSSPQPSPARPDTHGIRSIRPRKGHLSVCLLAAGEENVPSFAPYNAPKIKVWPPLPFGIVRGSSPCFYFCQPQRTVNTDNERQTCWWQDANSCPSVCLRPFKSKGKFACIYSVYLRQETFGGRVHFLLPADETSPGVDYLKAPRRARKLRQVGSCTPRSQSSPPRRFSSTAHSEGPDSRPFPTSRLQLLRDIFLLLSANR